MPDSYCKPLIWSDIIAYWYQIVPFLTAAEMLQVHRLQFTFVHVEDVIYDLWNSAIVDDLNVNYLK